MPPPSHAAKGRWHFVDPAPPALAYSVLFSRSPEEDETRLLVECSSLRFELLSRQDVTGRDSIESVKEVGSGETLSRRLLLSRSGAIPGCEAVQSPDACLLFSGSRGKFDTSLSALGGKDAPSLRGRIAALLSDEGRARLFVLAGQFGRSAEFSAYRDDFLRLIWPELFSKPIVSGQATRTPGCVFDATFGFPCGEAERRSEEARFRLRAAAKP